MNCILPGLSDTRSISTPMVTLESGQTLVLGTIYVPKGYMLIPSLVNLSVSHLEVTDDSITENISGMKSAILGIYSSTGTASPIATVHADLGCNEIEFCDGLPCVEPGKYSIVLSNNLIGARVSVCASISALVAHV